MQHRTEHLMGRLTSRAPAQPAGRPQPGTHPLDGSAGRQHLLLVPAEPSPAGAGPGAPRASSAGSPGLPLVVMLHGAGSEPLRTLRLIERQAAAAGVAVLLPKSSGYTWDAVLGGFGPDIAELDRLLDATFRMLAVDPRRIAVAGFSDGASYALSVGRVNGGLFGSVLAFSPGFVVPGPPSGVPRIFVSHGTADTVLPIQRCSRLLVPALRREGYEVHYREFDGGHVVPPELAEEALGWAARAPESASPSHPAEW